MQDFLTLKSDNFTLENVLAYQASEPSGFTAQNISVANGKIVSEIQQEKVDCKGRMLLPTFTDMHTHLDKGHIWQRQPNPDGTFMGALNAVGEDRIANWCAQDVRKRMEFSLKCAYAHGTSTIRTHLDSLAPQDQISWPVFCELRDKWADKITLQASCLVPIDKVEKTGEFLHTANLVKQCAGTLGAVTYPMNDLDERLDVFLAMASERGLDADFHADETCDPSVATLRSIAKAVLRSGFGASVTVGHCCSLAVQSEGDAGETLDLVAKAGINIVSLPLCNLYLQAREKNKTPRWRGITLVHEMRARGINVSFASDNTRDPFYAYGDLDMVEVMRESIRIAHLDHTEPHWMDAFSANPRKACGFLSNDISAGKVADFVLFNARSMTELLARPQSDRAVVRNGKAITRQLPEYSELDELM